MASKLVPALAASKQGAKNRVSRRFTTPAPHELDERQHLDRIEKVETHHTFRVLEGAGDLGDGEGGGVGGEHAARRDDPFECAENFLLETDALEDGLDHEIRTAQCSVFGAVGDQRFQEHGSAGGHPALRHAFVEGTLDVAAGFLEDRFVYVLHHQRELRPLEEEGAELRTHQTRSDHAHLAEDPAGHIGFPRLPPDPLLGEVEAVDRGLCLSRGQQLRQGLLFSCQALAQLAAPGGKLDQVDGELRRAGRAVDLGFGERSRSGQRFVEARRGFLLGALGPLRLFATREDLEQAQRVFEKIDRFEQPVREAQGEGLFGAQGAVLIQRVVDHELEGLGTAEHSRCQLRAAPGRDDGEKHFGEGQGSGVAGNAPMIAVERDLESAPHADAVDCGEGRQRELAQAAEEFVPAATSAPREIGVDSDEFLEVGAGGKNEGLARQHQPARLTARHRVEGALEVVEGRSPESRGLGVVLAVVDGHDRKAPGRGALVPLQLEVGDLLAHARSQRTAAPMPSPTHMVVRPRRASLLRSKYDASCIASRAPDMARGCPRAMAPP
jgi:hypothetical protein